MESCEQGMRREETQEGNRGHAAAADSGGLARPEHRIERATNAAEGAG